jgi:biopolymer transport protein ExbD
MQAFGPQRSLKSDINITPLIDIVLVLLIVFIVMVPVLTRQHPVSIPSREGGKARGPEPTPLVLTVLKDGGLKLQQESLGAEALVDRLAEALGRQDGQSRKVFVKVDGDQCFQRTVDALDLVRRASDRVKRGEDLDAAAALSIQKPSA